MAYRANGGGSRVGDYEERETYYSSGPRRAPAPVREYEDIEIRERDRESRVPAFLRDEPRRGDAGPLVLRQRDVETVERRRRSPSPVRVRETRLVERTRSVSPAPRRRSVEREREDVRVRTIERERIRSPSRGPPMERVRTRIVERERSPSPVAIERVRSRIVERERSPSPIEREREHIRIIERERERERVPTPSPSPSPPPPVLRGPTIEREVITHYRDIDHGIIPARLPSPPPPPRTRAKERETDIDIYTSRNETEVDIHKSVRHRGRSPSRERPSPARVYEDEVRVHSDRDRLHVDISQERVSGRRSHSAAPPAIGYDDEAEYITSRIDSRGRMGEAWHGATKDWTIVDVPPGTDRVRMDGVGGGGAEVTWQKYSGVRRSKFIPERDSSTVVSSSTTISDREVRDRDRDRERLSVQVYDKERTRDRETRELDVSVEKVTDRRMSIRNPVGPPAVREKRSEMWTEITKDLVTREAIEQLGYEFEETEFFYYIMQYLRYDDVLELVQLSDSIRRSRKDRVREIQWEREYRDEYERDRVHIHRHRHRHSRSIDRYDDERVVEREVVYDRPPRYLR